MKQIMCAALVMASASLAPALAQTSPSANTTGIAAVVNGQVITTQDVDARSRLLAVSTGMQITPQILSRLAPQVTSQLIDQSLELQEINRRSIVIPEADVIGAVTHIEQGNGLPPGGLRAKLTAAGIPFDTLVSQLRIELGWQSVLHQVLGPGLQPVAGDMNAEKSALKAELGSTQYHISEIFIPVTDPADDAPAQNFANAVIAQLRTGAPFPIVAAQFSQAETALQGGDLGFVQLSQLDPAVAAIVTSMPNGAISNPVRVPGGYDIVQLQETHKVGTDMQTMLTLRQAFAAYPTPITNGVIGPEQAAIINKLQQTGRSATSCADIEADNTALGNVHPSDPGPVNLATITPPAFQTLLASLPIGKVSQPLVAQNGVSIVMVCSRQNQAVGLPSDNQISQIIIEHRVDLESQQLLDDLHHRSIIVQN
jgi:peptidyl-prolyl cis-trans isomerase SurA